MNVSPIDFDQYCNVCLLYIWNKGRGACLYELSKGDQRADIIISWAIPIFWDILVVSEDLTWIWTCTVQYSLQSLYYKHNQPGGYSQSWQFVHHWGMFLRRSQGLRQDCSQGPWGSWFASWALSCHCGSCSPTLQRLKMLLCLRHTDIWQRTDFSAGCPHFILCLLWGQGYIFKTPSQCWTNFLLTRAYVVTVRI